MQAEAALRVRIEAPHIARLWGKAYTVTPRFLADPVEIEPGAPSWLLAVQPLATRPEYYVARVVVSPHSDAHDYIDQVIDALIDEYGSVDDDDDDRAWPLVNLDVGFSWWTYEVPTAEKPKRRNPNAPTGYPTAADAEHTAHVEAIKAQREAEYQERRRAERERRAALTPEQRAAEDMRDVPRRPAHLLAVMAAIGASAEVRR